MLAIRARTVTATAVWLMPPAADVVITQPVEHVLDELAGRGGLGLVAAAAFGDLLAERADPGVRPRCTASSVAQRTRWSPAW